MYEKGNKVIVKITNITPYGAFCRAEKADGLIHISEVSDYYVRDIRDFFDVGDEIEVEVLDFDSVRKHLKLSYKKCHPELLKNDDKEIQEIKATFKSLNKKQNKTDNIENISKTTENE
ncbi:S1 RNA-binding domain-containing protein [Spiroplasma citri]|uniref:S1 RNA-binding domain-containing protein n=1 Tax=Spiroplasma citri TaxID=2133 RepID=UPI0013A0965E|nr:S1 RNA-binding domain-containing protein [Spiroplasma citri]QIA67741.1 S1 RNA-binding domain-containing protein [Spiroplasma citri]QIA73315.1 S1 RNA-binding domain-containing protein [Spiroplasma citri]